MSRLPPRCPLQSKGLSPNAPEFRPDNLSKTLNNQDQSFTDQPSWFEDLLNEPKKNLTLNPIRRSCSDSEVILDVLSNYPSEFGDFEPIDENESGSGFELESGLNYGPNSPREKSKLTSTESSIVKSVLENVPSNPLQYLVFDSVNGSGYLNGSTSNLNEFSETDKNPRRRSGQRSRVRKLQYIAELEHTVDTLQNFGAELAARVTSLFQLRAALSMENKNLRRQIATIKQEKLIKDVMSQSLRNEVERLKQMSGGRHRRSKSMASCMDLTGPGIEPDPLGMNWQMLDFNKLSLGGGTHVPVPPTRHSSGRF